MIYNNIYFIEKRLTMKRIFKYLMKSWKNVLLIVSLLVIQAICDLSLPGYTSNIINVGIQQGGITSSTPLVLREDTYKKINIFLNDDEKNIVSNHYQKLDKKNLSNLEYNN